MVAKSQLKLIKKLNQKKYRTENKLFFVEGRKVVSELLSAKFEPYLILASKDNLVFFSGSNNLQEITLTDLKKISALKNPNGVLGVFHQQDTKEIQYDDWIVALDAVQDPGNLGTIIRLCDWYGIEHLVCSEETVECYNPKVLQATMGSIARVTIHYLNLKDFLGTSEKAIFGAFMEGSSIYAENFKQPGILLMGNEANGISPSLKNHISKRITIPQFGNQTTESLNVAMATGILLNEIRRE